MCTAEATGTLGPTFHNFLDKYAFAKVKNPHWRQTHDEGTKYLTGNDKSRRIYRLKGRLAAIIRRGRANAVEHLARHVYLAALQAHIGVA